MRFSIVLDVVVWFGAREDRERVSIDRGVRM